LHHIHHLINTLFLITAPSPPEIYTLSLHDALPICVNACVYFHKTVSDLSKKFKERMKRYNYVTPTSYLELLTTFNTILNKNKKLDRKSTRLNSSHVKISYAVFCLKKKKKKDITKKQ